MATFEESFLYPLILLLVGAGLSGLLFPFFTNRWQIHQKGLEIKIDLAGRMSQTVMGMITMIEFILTSALDFTGDSRKPLDDLNKGELDKEYRKLRADGAAIWAELYSYFPNHEDIGNKWHDLIEEIGSCYRQAKKISEKAKSNGNEAISEGAKLHREKAKSDVEDMKIQFEEKTRKGFLSGKYDSMELVLYTPMPKFSLLPGFIARSSLYKWLYKEGYVNTGPKRKKQIRERKEKS